MKAKRPTKGSVAILNAKAVKGSLTLGLRKISAPVSGLVPITPSLSIGLGNNSITKSSMV